MDGTARPGTDAGLSINVDGPCRVVIADDNAVIRMGVRSLLAGADDIEVVGEAGDGRAAIEQVRLHHPDVLLLDVRMPRQDGVSTVNEVAADTAVIMLTYSDAPEVINAAVRGGARSYLVHGQFSADELIGAVRMARRGMGTFSPQAVAQLASVGRPAHGELIERHGLSEREVEVMELIAKGAPNADIAGALFISQKTVKNHVNRIFAKLGVTRRGEAIALWLDGSR